MRAELSDHGFEELFFDYEVDKALSQKGTTLIMVNSWLCRKKCQTRRYTVFKKQQKTKKSLHRFCRCGYRSNSKN